MPFDGEMAYVALCFVNYFAGMGMEREKGGGDLSPSLFFSIQHTFFIYGQLVEDTGG